MSAYESISKAGNKYPYVFALFGITVAVYLINKFMLTGSQDTWSRNPLSVPVACLVMLGVGFLIRVILRMPVELNKSAKYGFHVYLMLVIIIPLLLTLSMVMYRTKIIDIIFN